MECSGELICSKKPGRLLKAAEVADHGFKKI